MSGIAGIRNLDGRPVERALLHKLTAALAHRGPDGIRYWSDGPVGFAHLMLHTTPESLREHQPLRHAHSGLSLTLDGRVDNREELRAALESKGCAPHADTDADLVLRAYECWGEDCPGRIIGDFAFAIWSERDRTLFCARDPVGIKPFYYIAGRTAFSFSSELRPLLEAPNFQRKPNLGMLGEYLSDDVTSQDETLYQGILRLPPGHRLLLKDGAPRLSRYFQIDPCKTIRYRSDAEYTEHFFNIFKEAVRCRLRSQSPVSQFVSGGLDSSSILGMTHQLIRDGTVETAAPSVYSLVSCHPDTDERTYLHDLAGMWGDKVQSAGMNDTATAPLVEQAQRFLDFPDFPNSSVYEPLYDLARHNGSRVTFWGCGGDEWLTGDRAHCADLLLRLRLTALIRQIRCDVAQSNIWGSRLFTARDAAQWCLFPLVPRALKVHIKRRTQSGVPRWIAREFARAIGLQDRLIAPAPPPFPTMAQRAICTPLLRGADALSNEMQDRFDARHGMEPRYPFYDRRLIEFALALPEDQRWRDDQTKHVLRQAMRGLLPNSILERKSKAEFSHLFKRSIEQESAGKVIQSLRLGAAGFVDAAVIREMHDQCMRGDRLPMGPVWMILALEYWYRIAFPEVA